MRSHARKILHHSSICNSKELEITQEELWHIPVIGYYSAVGRHEEGIYKA